jgi:hypothetical protein
VYDGTVLGSAFALNAVIETERLRLVAGSPQAGRCMKCGTCLWSHHRLLGDALAIVRVGTLDEGNRVVPDVHCYTATKHPWVAIPEGVPAFEEGYDPATAWSAEALARVGAVREGP